MLGMLHISGGGRGGDSTGQKEGQEKKTYQGRAKLKGNWSLCLEQSQKHDFSVLPPTHQDLGGRRSLEEAVQGLWDEV